MEFSKAFDKREHRSVSLKGRQSGNFASIVIVTPNCFALLAKGDKIKLIVSLLQNRMGVIASISD